MKGVTTLDAYPNEGVYTYIAFDRNGIASAKTGMTYEKLATYSSAKAKMLHGGTSLV